MHSIFPKLHTYTHLILIFFFFSFQVVIEETYSWWQSPRFFCSNPASETLKVTVLLDMVFRETTLDAENNPESLVFKDASEVLCGPALGSDSLPDSTDCLWQSWWWFSSLAMISNMFKMMWSILDSDVGDPIEAFAPLSDSWQVVGKGMCVY